MTPQEQTAIEGASLLFFLLSIALTLFCFGALICVYLINNRIRELRNVVQTDFLPAQRQMVQTQAEILGLMGRIDWRLSQIQAALPPPAQPFVD